MTILSLLVISVFTIIGSALASAYVNVSRERLWLRSSKAEDLYRSIEAAHAAVSSHFMTRLDLAKGRYTPLSPEPIMTALSDVKVAVALYFPEVRRELACVEDAVSTLLAAVHAAEAADKHESDEALCNLDVAICNLKDGFGLLKSAVLQAAEMKESWIARKLRREPAIASRPMRSLQMPRA